MPSDPPKGVSGEAWLHKLLSYVNTMRTSYPNVPDPQDDWVTDGAKSHSLGQNSSAVGQSSIQLDTARDQKLKRIDRILDKQTKRNTAAELRARQTYLEQREKNRQVRVRKFAQKPHQYHAGDLFDIEMLNLDLAEHARHLIPNLAPLVGQPILNSTDFELRG